ncbi:hypothetical protein ACFQU7_12305 [Pseudoroseomonas wenyumeiae]
MRAEIDRIDDALHDLLMRRAGISATMAASRVKGTAATFRPARRPPSCAACWAATPAPCRARCWCVFGVTSSHPPWRSRAPSPWRSRAPTTANPRIWRAAISAC